MNNFDPKRAWLDELLARPMLWSGQIDALKVLAAELGVKIVFFRRDLDNWQAGWRPEDSETGGNYETVAEGGHHRTGADAGGGDGVDAQPRLGE